MPGPGAMALQTLTLLTFALAVSSQTATRIVVSNDDGWAVAQIRAQHDALNAAAGYDVVLSCPAINKSGSGSLSTTPTVLTTPCEFDTCPVGSPAQGFNASSPRLNYVNGFPVDAVRYGIQTLAPKFFKGSKPDIVVSGPNVGSNLGLSTLFSGTIGAASEAALQGIPAVAFSGSTGDQVSYTTLTTAPTSANTKAALIYSQLSVTLLKTLLASPGPILPAGIALNVNYPPTSNCTDAAAFKFVLTRIYFNLFATDVRTCGTTRLPTESSVVAKSGCFASVSVFNAKTKLDADAATQGVVLAKLSSLLTCSN
ncbi:sure-like protein [Mycena belliarum]|uniref:Sure-like protein n=1 Tax=Mycena belliarum TaxID=1033014 RepID=A0AAD6TXI4_9AGAR|nr:sure-like protein [Mycena belliae]